ncbi:MAG: 3-oxoacid CoA-transferase [Oligoflexia bacterium]|nr:3-oxoacid CoA-transferase [Oligoflexia bacterium]MBF0364598.1 3-oxoacid CoA-transferase [Oligoflexia bacterium]
MSTYNKMELMVCAASRELLDNTMVIIGTGVPCAAGMLAQKMHAPNLVIFFEAGGAGPMLPTMPVSVGDSRTSYRATMATTMLDVMELAQRGAVDFSFIGGAQIDCYGNINSTVVGDYRKPKVRFPGSGGANDLASLCKKTLVVTNHDKKRFVEKVDFITTPGYLQGPHSREDAGLPAGTGPYRVITDLAVMDYDPQSLRMRVISLHPNVTIDEVKVNTGFELLVSEKLAKTEPPSEKELRILREEIDPFRYVIGRGA